MIIFFFKYNKSPFIRQNFKYIILSIILNNNKTNYHILYNEYVHMVIQ